VATVISAVPAASSHATLSTDATLTLQLLHATGDDTEPLEVQVSAMPERRLVSGTLKTAGSNGGGVVVTELEARRQQLLQKLA